MGVDFSVLCFAILLAFAVRFEPTSLEHQLSILSEGAWALIAVQMLALLISGFYPVSYTHLTLPTNREV